MDIDRIEIPCSDGTLIVVDSPDEKDSVTVRFISPDARLLDAVDVKWDAKKLVSKPIT